MDEDDFKGTRTGRMVWESKGAYFRFEPKELPLNLGSTEKINNLLVEASINLGRLDSVANKFSDGEAKLVITPFIVKEATVSSEIEGTRSTLADVYKGEKEKEEDAEKALDNQEVKNYIRALEVGLKRVKNEPISEKLIKDLHKILLRGVRGQNKSPGEYKRLQNGIGNDGDNYETAKFIPASPETTPHLMKNFVEYINEDKGINPLYKISMIHYQFETIHPFQDGNGRIGRLLIILYLCRENILGQPLLYLSEFFKKYRKKYTDGMYNVSSKNQIVEWLEFFLDGINTQSKKSLEFAKKLDDYKTSLKERLQKTSRSLKVLSIVDMLFQNPFITIYDVAKTLGVTHTAASRLIRGLEKQKVIREYTKRTRNKVYLAPGILKILNY